MDEIVHLAVVAHHLIRFTRDCLRGMEEASFYVDPNRSADGSGAPELASASG